LTSFFTHSLVGCYHAEQIASSLTAVNPQEAKFKCQADACTHGNWLCPVNADYNHVLPQTTFCTV